MRSEYRVIGARGSAPIAYGAIADHSSRTVGVIAAALTAAAIIPMADAREVPTFR
jgi:hypothetical protein